MAERVNFFVKDGNYTDYIQVNESKKRVIFEYMVGSLTDKKVIDKNKRELDGSILEEMAHYIGQMESKTYKETQTGFYQYIQHLEHLLTKYDESEK